MKHRSKSWKRLISRAAYHSVVVIPLAFLFLSFVYDVFGQGRQVDQGRPTATTSAWPVKICDASVTCTGAILTVIANAGTGTFNVTGTVTANAAGTQAVSGTVNIGGTSTITGTVSVTSGTIGQITMPTLSVTSGTIGSITMPSLTFTSGTVNSMPPLSVTSGTIGSMPSLSVTSATIGLITMPSLTVTSGTIGNTVTISPTGTQSINLAQVLGAAMTTANPVVSGGRGATDTVTGVANAAIVGQMMDKWGRTVVILGTPDEMNGTTNFTLTATTASALQAAPGANYKWAIDGWRTCNTTSTAATRIDLQFGTTAKDSVPWLATTTAGGEPRCYEVIFVPPLLSPANTAVNVQLATAVTDVRGVVMMHKTGT